MRATCGILFLSILLSVSLGCEDARKKKLGDSCEDSSQCTSGLCFENRCLDPDGDEDGDGLKNGVEVNLLGTNPEARDSDADGIDDGLEIGPDLGVPLDVDGDGKRDALESVIADADRDCLPDQFDPDDANPTQDPAALVAQHCTLRGVCDTGRGQIVATCTEAAATCDYAAVPGWEADETTCDGLDNDCDGDTDEGLSAVDDGTCPATGVCGAQGVALSLACDAGKWVCVLSPVPGWQAVEDRCDDLDNDCDGDTDEGLAGTPCSWKIEGVGECLGTNRCDGDGGIACDALQPVAETCNGLDDDCDDSTDEGLAGEACANGECQGVTVCDGNGGAVCNAPTPTVEICNGVDDDCNDGVDEEDVCLRTGAIAGIVRGRLPVPPVAAFGVQLADGPGPLAGVRVIAGPCQMPTGATGPQLAVASQETVTGVDGSFHLPVYPGVYCVTFRHDGYLDVITGDLEVPEGDTWSLEVALTLQASPEQFASVCGLVRTYVDDQDQPVPSAYVALLDLAGGELAATTADAAGRWCLAGIPPSIATGESWLSLVARKDGFFEGRSEVWLQPDVVPISRIYLTMVPPLATSCLDTSFDGATELAFQPDPILEGVGWQFVRAGSMVCRKPQECALAPLTEQCLPGEADCALCKPDTFEPEGCIPWEGCLPQPRSAPAAMWFGNAEMGGYLPWQSTPCEGFVPVGGSLTSRTVYAYQVQDLVLSFWSAWEVEAESTQHDQMLVEVRPWGSEAWATVLTLRPATKPPLLPSGTPQSSGGIQRSPVWTQYKTDITAYAGGDLQVRFRFDSVDANFNAFRGWMIDDVAITGRGCQNWAR